MGLGSRLGIPGDFGFHERALRAGSTSSSSSCAMRPGWALSVTFDPIDWNALFVGWEY